MDETWRTKPAEEQTFAQQKRLREEAKAMDRLASQKVQTKCPGCGGVFQGHEQGALFVQNGTATLVHSWCQGEARRLGWQLAMVVGPITKRSS